MEDKFFNTARDRFQAHHEHIKRDLEYLEYMDYDYRGKLSPDFRMQIEAVKAAMKRMEELVEELSKE
jgi:hypothetical protein